MADIDFLPLEYHLAHARSEVKPWRIVVVGCAATLVAVAVVVQCFQRGRVLAELAATASVYEGASQHDATWAAFETRLNAARSDADLFNYLRHPWPRSQLLSAVVLPMPPEICVLHLEISGEAKPRAAVEARTRAEIKAEEDRLRKAPPGVRDLSRLRDDCDAQQTCLRIAGTTADTAALYRYLNDLTKVSYFTRVELKSIESADTPQGPIMHFQAILRVRPGYGQPGGPKGKSETKAIGKNAKR